MAKLIKMTDEYKAECLREFQETLEKSKLSDGRIAYTKSFGTVNKKADLFFTEIAWLKMQTLIREFDKEVAWHGVAFRGDAEPGENPYYIISDILVYPQEVTGATVNTDQEKYQTWLMSHEDDVFNNIRMQGHSHVNMGVTPSAVDTSLYERILEQLEDDMFYIFLIYNKRGEKTVKIYDLAENLLYENSDVTVSIIDDGPGIESFLADAKELVQTKSYGAGSGYSTGGAVGYGGYGGYGGYYGSGYSSGYGASSQKDDTKPYNPIKPSGASKEEDERKIVTPVASGKKSKKKEKKKTRMSGGAIQELPPANQCSMYGFDDDDDPYSAFGYYSGR